MPEKDTSYYVYVIDRPWNGEPAYIGKGKEDRHQVHARFNEKHPNREVAAVFLKAEALGIKVRSRILLCNLTEDEALHFEILLIAQIGRLDLGTGPLANLTDGGEGWTNMTVEAKERHRAAVIASFKRPEVRAKNRITIQKAVAASRHKRATDPEFVERERLGGRKGVAITNANRKRLRETDPAYAELEQDRIRKAREALTPEMLKRQLDAGRAKVSLLWKDPIWKAAHLAKMRAGRRENR